jgi:hypothetical protein
LARQRSAITGREQMRQIEPLFDHLIGAADKRQRHGDAERLGRLEVDDQLELGSVLDRQVGRLVTLENAAGVDPDLAKRVEIVRSITYQPAGHRGVASRVHRG